MALGRLDVPARRPLQRDDLPGHVQGPAERDRGHRLRGDRRVPGRQDHARRAVRDRERRLPGPGCLRRPVHGQHDVHASWSSSASRRPASTASRPRTRPRTRRPARPASWSWTSSGATSGRRTIVTRDALENGIASVAATGGSTNGVLHLLAIAHEFGHPARHRRVRRVADRTPIVADMQPGGRLHRDRHLRSGRRRARHARAAQARAATRRRADGRRPDDRRDRGGASSRRPARRSSSRSIGRSSRPAAWRSCTARLAPDGCVVKLAGHERRQHRGPARVFDSETACYEAVRDRTDRRRRRRRHPLRGTGRRPGHAGDAERDGRARRRGPGRFGRAASPTAASAAAPTG